MNVRCLIRFHVNMLTLFNRLLTKEQMSMQKVIMEKILLHLTCANNNDRVILILCMVLKLLFISFFDS
jgi:hypothetical protein